MRLRVRQVYLVSPTRSRSVIKRNNGGRAIKKKKERKEGTPVCVCVCVKYARDYANATTTTSTCCCDAKWRTDVKVNRVWANDCSSSGINGVAIYRFSSRDSRSDAKCKIWFRKIARFCLFARPNLSESTALAMNARSEKERGKRKKRDKEQRINTLNVEGTSSTRRVKFVWGAHVSMTICGVKNFTMTFLDNKNGKNEAKRLAKTTFART